MLPVVRICTWNIQLGRRLDAVLDAISTHQDFGELDLLALQEASIHDGREDAAAIADVLGAEYQWFQATAQMLRGRNQGNGLIWRRSEFEPSPPQIVALTRAGSSEMRRAERALLRAIPPQRRIAIRAES